MKTLIYIAVALAAIVSGFFALNAYIYNEKQEGGETTETATLSGTALSFSYRGDPYGYRLDSLTPRSGDEASFIGAAVLMLESDFEAMQGAAPGESPPTITIAAYRNPANLTPATWAGEYPQFSNLPLMVGEARETTIAGAPAIRYLVDGLYRMDTVLVAHRTTIYLISGGFLEEDSLVRRDFETFVESLSLAGVPESRNDEPRVAPSSGKVIDMSGRGFTRVPMDIFTQTDATVLDLSGNALTGALPAEVRHLGELVRLDLSGNRFTGVPAEIGQLAQLEYLDLSENPITGLPLELGNLSALKELDLRGTQYAEQDLSQIRARIPQARILTD